MNIIFALFIIFLRLIIPEPIVSSRDIVLHDSFLILGKMYPPARKARRKVANLTEGKNNYHSYGVKELMTSLSVFKKFDLNYFKTG